jgi:hypothetical protein
MAPGNGPLPLDYLALLVVRPDGDLTEVCLTPGDDPLAEVLGRLDCLLPERIGLTSRLAMWGVGDDPKHRLPWNVLAAGLAHRYGHQPRCYHGTVLLCGADPDGGPAGLTLSQMLGLHAQLSDVAESL